MRATNAFELYLRTGRRAGRGSIEFKFNPWHDPDDGRFTFAGQGRYFQGDRAMRRGREARAFAAASNGVASGAGQDPFAQHDPHNPRNHGIYVVRRGDNLTRIAAGRRGLTVADLEWLNGISATRPLRIGQRLKIPHQQFLDDGKRAYEKFLALNYYARTHGGRLPPNPENPPTLESQILDSNWRRESRNGYDFLIDALSRPRKMFGEVSFAEVPKRSRRLQAQAGGRDRRPTDDGGHYVAARFNGPLESFNHFAQDDNFNRGAYRLLEDQWAKNKRTRKKVFIEIVPHYPGRSLRPDRIVVIWSVDGRKSRANFANESGGKAGER